MNWALFVAGLFIVFILCYSIRDIIFPINNKE